MDDGGISQALVQALLGTGVNSLNNMKRNAYASDRYMGQGAGQYAGPLPSYFKGRESTEANKGLVDSAFGLAGTVGSLAAPEALALFGPTAALGWAGSMAHGAEADKLRQAADMWRLTGMPQRPKP